MIGRWEAETAGAGDFVPIGGAWQFQQVGQWTDVMGRDRPLAVALDARRITSRIDLGRQTPAKGVIAWADGRTEPTELLAVKEGFDRLLAGGIRCVNCPDGTVDGVKPTPLSVTAATLSTMRVNTSRGLATIPAWRFTFAETKVQALEAAVRAPTVATTDPDSTTKPQMLAIERVGLAPDGRTLTAYFTGAPGTADKPCGADYGGYAVQSDRAVGIVIASATDPSNEGVCPAIGAVRTVTVRLDAPLQDRTVLETAGGTPVPITYR
jgi:hypothetical protein